MKYIIELKALDNKEEQSWRSAVRQTNSTCSFYDGYFIKEDFLKTYEDEENVLAFGSIGFCQKVIKRVNWTPGVYPLDHLVYNCSHYYPVLHDYLLNSDYIFLPFQSLTNRRGLADKFWKEGSIFIRPDSSLKTFTGGVVSSYKMKSDFDTLVGHVFDIEPHTMCVVSTPKNIKREWRLVCHNDNIITYSLYKEDGKIKLRNECPKDVLSFGDEICKVWHNDSYFTLDLCESDGIIRLLETGGLSYAGLYACDRVELLNYLNKNHS